MGKLVREARKIAKDHLRPGDLTPYPFGCRRGDLGGVGLFAVGARATHLPGPAGEGGGAPISLPDRPHRLRSGPALVLL
jgi:hypothetical protein